MIRPPQPDQLSDGMRPLSWRRMFSTIFIQVFPTPCKKKMLKGISEMSLSISTPFVIAPSCTITTLIARTSPQVIHNAGEQLHV